MEQDIQFTHGPIQIPAIQLPSREIGSMVEFHGIVRELVEPRTQVVVGDRRFGGAWCPLRRTLVGPDGLGHGHFLRGGSVHRLVGRLGLCGDGGC